MWWQYALVLFGTMLIDVIPFPIPPAFTVMIFFQIYYNLNMWGVIGLGVLGSIIGRTLLAGYIPFISNRLFNQSKNEDVQFLGKKIEEKGWKSKVLIFVYCLLPLPTAPIFIAAGMSKLSVFYILPSFIIGKLISNTTAMLFGKYAAKNTSDILCGIASWKSVTGLLLGLLMILGLLFIDWRTLLKQKKLRFRFSIFNR